MAKKSSVNKNERRRKLVAKYAAKRAALKETIFNPNTTPEARAEAYTLLNALPRNSSAVRVVNRCALTGRPRGNLRHFTLCRITFREKALRGELTGVTKASW